MDAAVALKRRSGRRHIPIEVTEEILLHLPVKSLIRFSSVSRSWNSKVFEPGFARKHKDRAALLRRHRTVISAMDWNRDFSCFFDISSISPDQPIVTEIKLRRAGKTFLPENPTFVAADTVGRFHRRTRLRAYCDELWLVEVEKKSVKVQKKSVKKWSLYLWNPSMRSYRRIPKPQFPCRRFCSLGDFIYALGYDSVSDDYKLLKLPHEEERSEVTEVYSLKSNCWRTIESPSFIPIWNQDRCEFLNGKFHWVGSDETSKMAIVSFDLSTEKYGSMKLPKTKYYFSDEEEGMQVVVVRGMLCLCLNYHTDSRFKIWVMEEYGDEASWTIKYDIRYFDDLSYMEELIGDPESPLKLRPLHIYDNDDDIAIVAFDINYGVFEMVVYKNKGREAKRIASCVPYTVFCNFEAFFYVESLISVAL